VQDDLWVLDELEVDIADFCRIDRLIACERHYCIIGRIDRIVGFFQTLAERPIVDSTVMEGAVVHSNSELLSLSDKLSDRCHEILSQCFHFLRLLVVKWFEIPTGNLQLHLHLINIVKDIFGTGHLSVPLFTADSVHDFTGVDFEAEGFRALLFGVGF